MKTKPILLSFISIFFFVFAGFSQKDKKQQDSIQKIEKYGLRLGADLAKPIRSVFEKGYTGFEINGDFRLTKRFFAAAELGHENKDWIEPYVSSKTSGSYAKLGFDFNAYENWIGMENAINLGLRYGFSTFNQELLSYRIYTDNPAFPSELITDPVLYKGLSAHWVELIISVKTEIATNLFLSVNLQLKRMITQKHPDNFANLYVPGFNRTYDYSAFGVGYGYSVSYLIPVYKKKTAVSKP